MGRNGNKERKNSKQDSIVTEDTTKPWPDLPDQLINLISKDPSLLQTISYNGVSKMWRCASTKQCNDDSNKQFPSSELSFFCEHIDYYGISKLQWSNGSPPEADEDPIFGFSQGQLLFRSQKKPGEFYLWSPPGSFKRYLPKCDEHIPFQRVVLSASPDYKTNSMVFPFQRVVLSASPDYKTNSMVLVLTGRGSKPGFMFCNTKKREKTWIREECTLPDPNSSRNSCSFFIEFTNAVCFQGKFYVMSLQGTLAVIDTDSYKISPPTRVKILSVKRAIPSIWSRCFKEYLVESSGELWLVFLNFGKSFSAVEYIEVFRLDFKNMAWVKMESLGDRTLFVGVNCIMPVCAKELGCRGNCVYFTQNDIDGWWVFDMEKKEITKGWKDDSVDKSPTWVTPV